MNLDILTKLHLAAILIDYCNIIILSLKIIEKTAIDKFITQELLIEM